MRYAKRSNGGVVFDVGFAFEVAERSKGGVGVAFDVDVAVDFDFDFDFPRLALPFVRCEKWIKMCPLSEEKNRGFGLHASRLFFSEFRTHPIFCFAQTGTPAGGSDTGSPFFAYFLWRSKESMSLPGDSRQTHRDICRQPLTNDQRQSTHMAMFKHGSPIKSLGDDGNIRQWQSNRYAWVKVPTLHRSPPGDSQQTHRDICRQPLTNDQPQSAKAHTWQCSNMDPR